MGRCTSINPAWLMSRRGGGSSVSEISTSMPLARSQRRSSSERGFASAARYGFSTHEKKAGSAMNPRKEVPGSISKAGGWSKEKPKIEAEEGHFLGRFFHQSFQRSASVPKPSPVRAFMATEA